MFACSETLKSNRHIQRRNFAIRLEPSLLELLSIYASTGGPNEESLRIMEQAAERLLGDGRGDRETAQERLNQLLRTRDLHRFVMEAPAFGAVKVRMLEMVVRHKDMQERWAAIRALMLDNLDAVCQSPMPGLKRNLENHKRHLSQPGSQLGKMLVATALFNFDQDEETPPGNLMIRFRKGGFPHHSWEIISGGGQTTGHQTAAAWTPANPLCRWEYLAVDLAHAAYRLGTAGAQGTAYGQHTVGAQGTAGAHGTAYGQGTAGQYTVGQGTAGQHTVGAHGMMASVFPSREHPQAEGNAGGFSHPNGGSGGDTTLYCRLEPVEGDTPGEQMELFPVDPATFMLELQRNIHRRLGADGLKMMVVLMERLHRAPVDIPIDLNPGELAEAARDDQTARGKKTRERKLAKVINHLSRVELTRVTRHESGDTARTSQFLAILGHAKIWSGDQGGLAAREGKTDYAATTKTTLNVESGEMPRRVRVLADPLLHQAHESGLGECHADIPRVVLDARVKDHPYLLSLYVFLRNAWSKSDGRWSTGDGTWSTGDGIRTGSGTGKNTGKGADDDGVITRTARQLFHEAGLWVSESGRYRALESLKRDLAMMKEHGLLGSWRMMRSPTRDGMEDRYRLEAAGYQGSIIQKGAAENNIAEQSTAGKGTAGEPNFSSDGFGSDHGSEGAGRMPRQSALGKDESEEPDDLSGKILSA